VWPQKKKRGAYTWAVGQKTYKDLRKTHDVDGRRILNQFFILKKCELL